MNRLWILCSALLATAQAQAQAQAGHDCLLEPSQTVELRTAVDGLIDQVLVQRADRVRQGQTLVVLQSSVEQVAVASAQFRAGMQGQISTAQSRLKLAQAKFDRADQLQRERLVTAQAADEARAELALAQAELAAALEAREMARIDLQRAQAQLALRTLRSPFDGVVLARMQHPGDLAESGSGRKPVLTVAKVNPLRVDVTLPASLFGQVKAGTPMLLTLAETGARHRAAVQRVDPVIDAASGTFVARLALPNADGRLPSGMRCLARFDPPLVAPAPPAPRPPAASGPAGPSRIAPAG